MPSVLVVDKIAEATAVSAQGQLFRPTLKVIEAAPNPATIRVTQFGAKCADCDHPNHRNADGVRGECATFGCACKEHKSLTEAVHREVLTFHPRLLEGSYDPATRTADVIIIEDGMGNERDNHYYGPDSIRSAVTDGVFEGAQAFADHPGLDEDVNRPERSVRDLFGYYFNTRVTESNGKTLMNAKLKIQEGADWAVGLIKEAIAYNKRFPTKAYVGISINADGDVAPIQMNGKQVNNVRRITEAFSADMVTKPARGGRFLALVESASGARNTSKGESMTPKEAQTEAARMIEAIKSGTGEVDKTKLIESLTSFVNLKESDMKGMNTPGLSDMATSKGAFMESLSEADKAEYDKLDEAGKPPWLEKKMNEAMAQKKNASMIPNKVQGDNHDPTDAFGQSGDPMQEGSGKFTEAAKAYPSLYATALREARANVSEDVVKLRDENARLRAEAGLRESISTAKDKLVKANLPPASARRLMESLVGKTPDEMDRAIRFELDYHKELGIDIRRVEGANTADSVHLRESADRSNTNSFLAGVAGN